MVWGIQERGEGEVAAADGREHVAVAALGGREGREGVVLGLHDEAEQGRRVELAEAAAEGGGGGHRAAPRAAGEGGADEREGGEAEEDLEQEVLAEGVDSGGAR